MGAKFVSPVDVTLNGEATNYKCKFDSDCYGSYGDGSTYAIASTKQEKALRCCLYFGVEVAPTGNNKSVGNA